MAENDFDSREVWDEYDWERFLQEQDRNTEKYFDLLEQYMDHPERDEIIAKEMGWEHYSDDDGEVEVSVEFQAEEDLTELERAELEKFSYSPIYLETMHLHNLINSWLEKRPDLKDHPEAIRLTACSAICGAKLAAALCGEDRGEIGMTIAYLKRGLKAANDSLSAVAQLFQMKLLTPRQKSAFNHRIFRVRDHLVELIGGYRAEWRRRYGTL